MQITFNVVIIESKISDNIVSSHSSVPVRNTATSPTIVYTINLSLIKLELFLNYNFDIAI